MPLPSSSLAMLVFATFWTTNCAVAANLPTPDVLSPTDSITVTAIATPKPDQMIPESEDWAVHWQLTNITQKHNDFAAAYTGPQSLSPRGPTVETTDSTLMLGKQLWDGVEAWINPEVDQGFGFNNTLGMAGFPNGGAYKVGENTPYLRVPRLFIRQTVSLEGERMDLDSAPNQLANNIGVNNVTITVGKFSVTDIFDANTYAHDPRADFLNWTVIDGGAYDYAADSWGFTWGAAVEWTQDWWTLRAGFFQLSPVPNSKIVRINFGGNSSNLELETRHNWAGRDGKIKLLAFLNQGKMGRYQDAVLLGQETGSAPNVALVRRNASRPGVVLNLEQELGADVGGFMRWSANGGDKEAYEFTDINKSLSAGLSIKGNVWGQKDDTLGIAGVINRLSGQAQTYFAAGGMGILIGDGQLNYAPEKISEIYYSYHPLQSAALTIDYQHVTNPAYNQDRGPVSIFALRFHLSF